MALWDAISTDCFNGAADRDRRRQFDIEEYGRRFNASMGPPIVIGGGSSLR